MKFTKALHPRWKASFRIANSVAGNYENEKPVAFWGDSGVCTVYVHTRTPGYRRRYSYRNSGKPSLAPRVAETRINKRTNACVYVRGYRCRVCSSAEVYRRENFRGARDTCTAPFQPTVYRYYVGGRNDEVSMNVPAFLFPVSPRHIGEGARGREAGYIKAPRGDIAGRSSRDLSPRIFIIIS